MSNSDNKTKKKAYVPTLSFINANARSLGPKIESLFDCFTETKVDLALCTETWFQNGRDQCNNLADYSGNYGLGAVIRNRTNTAANGRQYGGVALLFKKSRAQMVEFPLVNPEDYEVLACVGTVHGIRGKVFVLTCYEPPNLTTHRANLMHEYIVDVLNEAKRPFQDCTMIMGGDFNQWPIHDVLEDLSEFTEVLHGPTRGERMIDRSFAELQT